MGIATSTVHLISAPNQPGRKQIYQSMTCDVRPQLAEVRCVVASWDVHSEPSLVVICNVRVRAVHFQSWEVRPKYCTFFTIIKELMIEICFPLV